MCTYSCIRIHLNIKIVLFLHLWHVTCDAVYLSSVRGGWFKMNTKYNQFVWRIPYWCLCYASIKYNCSQWGYYVCSAFLSAYCSDNWAGCCIYDLLTFSRPATADTIFLWTYHRLIITLKQKIPEDVILELVLQICTNLVNFC